MFICAPNTFRNFTYISISQFLLLNKKLRPPINPNQYTFQDDFICFIGDIKMDTPIFLQTVM